MKIFRHLQDGLTTRRGEEVDVGKSSRHGKVSLRPLLVDPILARCVWNNCVLRLSGKVVLHLSLKDLKLHSTKALASMESVSIEVTYAPSTRARTGV
jgi:hypothetical protein